MFHEDKEGVKDGPPSVFQLPGPTAATAPPHSPAPPTAPTPFLATRCRCCYQLGCCTALIPTLEKSLPAAVDLDSRQARRPLPGSRSFSTRAWWVTHAGTGVKTVEGCRAQ